MNEVKRTTSLKSAYSRDLPGSLVVKIPASNAGGMGLIPGWGTETHTPYGMAKINK